MWERDGGLPPDNRTVRALVAVLLPHNHYTTMGATDGAKSTTTTSAVELKAFPGEEPLAHQARDWLDSTQPKLAAEGLLIVAQTGRAPAGRC